MAAVNVSADCQVTAISGDHIKRTGQFATIAAETLKVCPMTSATIRLLNDAPDQLLANLDGRDAAVWLMPAFAAAAGPNVTARILGLPWNLVLSEAGDAPLLAALEAQEEADDPLPADFLGS